MTHRSVVIAKAGIWAACLAPLALLVLREFGYLGGFGPNPPEFVLDTCGKTGLNLLMLTLCITPIRRSTGWNRLVQFRRLLGLFAFFYLVLHFLTYALLDRGLLVDDDTRTVLETLGEDIALRPYITVGLTALLLLVPLAITSTRGFQRRLGRNWAKLHRLLYVAAILAVVHYWWQVKLDVAEPLLYAFLLAVLLGARLQHWRSVHAKTAMAAPYQRVEPPQAPEKASH